MAKQINAALSYDFDGTLIPGYMQEYSFFPALGIDEPQKQFWPRVREMTEQNDMDEILAYMHLMLKEADYRGVSVRKENFIECGRNIAFFPGVENWFDRINAYAAARGIKLRHYIISSGLREMIEGTKIFRHFACVYASGYMYNQDGIAVWPALAVNYTTKTQYIFRINKGVDNSWNNKAVNEYMDDAERAIPKENIIYIGDGETDVPAMKMVNYLGGHSISVYNEKIGRTKTVSEQLFEQKRTQYICPADYRENSKLDRLVKNLLDNIALKAE